MSSGNASDFIPIIFTVLVAGGFVATTLFATHRLGPMRKTKRNSKRSNVELKYREMRGFLFL